MIHDRLNVDMYTTRTEVLKKSKKPNQIKDIT